MKFSRLKIPLMPLFVLSLLVFNGCTSNEAEVFVIPNVALNGEYDMRVFPEDQVPLALEGDDIVALKYQYLGMLNRLWLSGSSLDERIFLLGQDEWENGRRTTDDTIAIGFYEVLDGDSWIYGGELIDNSYDAGLYRENYVEGSVIGAGSENYGANRISVALPSDEPGCYRISLYFRELIAGGDASVPELNGSTGDDLYTVSFELGLQSPSTASLTDAVLLSTENGEAGIYISTRNADNTKLTLSDDIGVEMLNDGYWSENRNVHIEVSSSTSFDAGDPYYENSALNHSLGNHYLSLSGLLPGDYRVTVVFNGENDSSYTLQLRLKFSEE